MTCADNTTAYYSPTSYNSTCAIFPKTSFMWDSNSIYFLSDKHVRWKDLTSPMIHVKPGLRASPGELLPLHTFLALDQRNCNSPANCEVQHAIQLNVSTSWKPCMVSKKLGFFIFPHASENGESNRTMVWNGTKRCYVLSYLMNRDGRCWHTNSASNDQGEPCIIGFLAVMLALMSSITGILHLFNQTPIGGYIKKQLRVEPVTDGSEFIAVCMCIEQTTDLHTTLSYLGVPIHEKSFVFGDNKSMIDSAAFPCAKPHKCHTMTAGIAAIYRVDGISNPVNIFRYWGYSQVWQILRPPFFWKGDTMAIVDEEDNKAKPDKWDVPTVFTKSDK